VITSTAQQGKHWGLGHAQTDRGPRLPRTSRRSGATPSPRPLPSHWTDPPAPRSRWAGGSVCQYRDRGTHSGSHQRAVGSRTMTSSENASPSQVALMTTPSTRSGRSSHAATGRDTPTDLATSVAVPPANTARTASNRCSPCTDAPPDPPLSPQRQRRRAPHAPRPGDAPPQTTQPEPIPASLNPDAPRRRRAQTGRNRPLSQITWRTTVAYQSTEDRAQHSMSRLS
jgi:hypothetical protein